MIFIESISLQHDLHATFKRLTSLVRFLKWKGLWPLVKCGICSAFIWAVFAWVFIRFDPWGNLTFFEVFGGKKLALAVLAELFTVPLFVGFLVIYSKQVKKVLLQRGIVVTGWHWRGREVDELMLANFSDYLKEKGLLNLASVEQIIEATRDENNWKTRSQNVGFVIAGIVLACVIGIGQPFVTVLAEDSAKQHLFGKLLVAIMELSVSFGVTAWMFHQAYFGGRSRWETYLQSLHHIVLSLPTDTIADGKTVSKPAPVTAPVKRSRWGQIIAPIAALLIVQTVGRALRHDKDCD